MASLTVRCRLAVYATLGCATSTLPPSTLIPCLCRGRRWLRGHHSPPPLCAALLALRGDGTVTLVGEGGRWMEGFRGGRILVIVIGWLDGSWMDWMGLGRRGKGQCPKNPPPDQIVCCLRAAIVAVQPRGWARWFGRCAAHARWLILICSAVPPWLRVTIIRSHPPSSCRGDERLAPTRR